MAADATDLGARVRRLEDEHAILDTLARYGHAIDRGPDADWLDCFTEDAAWDNRTGLAHRVRRYEGRAELAAFIARHGRAPEETHLHLLVEPRVAVDGDVATAASYWVRLDPDAGGAPVVSSFGRYRDRLVRCADGRWRIAERIVEADAWRR